MMNIITTTNINNNINTNNNPKIVKHRRQQPNRSTNSS